MSLTMQEYKKRRSELANKLPTASAVIIKSAKEYTRSNDIPFEFRQNSNFYYLTGFNEPESLAVIIKHTNSTIEYILFNQEKNPEKECWTGKRIGQAGAKSKYLADRAYPITELAAMMPTLLTGSNNLYHLPGQSKKFDAQVVKWAGKNKSFDISEILLNMRLKKSSAEITILRAAAKLSAQAHIEVMKKMQAGLKEHQIDGIFKGYCETNGSRYVAYPSVVANGNNANTLHYTANDDLLIAGELCLIDAGCELENYSSDITRTLPVNGRFSSAQLALYNIVLQAQDAGIAAALPGASFATIENVIAENIVRGLLHLNILQGNFADNMQNLNYKKYYMHGFGHCLGLDVHELPKDRDNFILEPSMALTIEPGIYIAIDDQSVPPQYRGIGIRIEDDILITATGNENLSKLAPKYPEDIEATMRNNLAPSQQITPLYSNQNTQTKFQNIAFSNLQQNPGYYTPASKLFVPRYT